MGRSGDGVEIRPKSIRLFFVDPDGVRRRETLTLNGVLVVAAGVLARWRLHNHPEALLGLMRSLSR